MKRGSVHCIVAALVSGAWSMTASAQPAQLDGDRDAGEQKAAMCAACHGADGNSMIPDFPSIAGQSASYAYAQLQAYKAGSRPNSAVMQPIAEPLSDQDMKDISVYYASLAAKPAIATEDTDRDALEAGRTLYTQGDAAAGVPPCQGCHGVAGRGVEPSAVAPDAIRPTTAWHLYPRLAGQQTNYTLAQLEAYRSGSRAGTTTARIMSGAVQNLDDGSMAALAAYLAQE